MRNASCSIAVTCGYASRKIEEVNNFFTWGGPGRTRTPPTSGFATVTERALVVLCATAGFS
jgi:hypothetical protein